MMHPARAATPASRIALVRVAASAVALGLAGVALLVAASRLAAAPSAHHALPEKSALPLDAITGALPANHPPLISQPSGWQPKCTRDATAVGSPQGDLLVERQALYDAFCNKYDWLKDGTGPQKACVEVGMAELEPGKRQCKVNVFGKDEPMLSGDEESADLHACFGPLGHLLGTWEGSAGKVYTAVPAYSCAPLPLRAACGACPPPTARSQRPPTPTSSGTRAAHALPITRPTAADEGTFLKEEIALIPGQPSATFHSIKNQTYREEITFEPVLGAVRNRGYEGANGISPGCQMDQFLYGVRYKLQVYQTSPTDEDGEEGGLLHEEVGMYMYNAVPASGGGSDWMVSRMGVVPHGVTMAAQGTFNSSSGSGAKEELLKSLRGANLDVTPVPQACFPADSYTTADQDWGPASAGVRDEDSTAENPTYLTMNPFLVSEAEQFESVLGSAHVVLKAEQLSQTPVCAPLPAALPSLPLLRMCSIGPLDPSPHACAGLTRHSLPFPRRCYLSLLPSVCGP